MASLKEIKQKIRSTARTRTVTRAMEAVSAAKMRKTQSAAIQGRAYARAATAILARVSGTQGLKNHVLAAQNSSQTTLYIVITSDKGLAGALNSAVLRAVAADIKQGDKVITIGRKAHDFFTKRGIELLAYHHNTGELSHELIAEVVALAAERFAAGAVGSVRICYQNFISTFEQRPTLRTIFPLSLEELQKVVADIVPVRGAQVHVREESSVTNYTVEPSEQEVMDAILPRLASIFVYHALLESQASEHSARMVAMKGASDKAAEMQHGLTLQFNKARQAAITREVSEIIAGQL